MTSSPRTDAAAITADPDWLPHVYHPRDEVLQLVRLPREARRKMAFLDWRWIGPELERAAVPLAEIEQALADAPAGRCHFIFHSAFCGSTLLARALDIEGRTASLREPNIFISLWDHAVEAGSIAPARRPLAAVLALLARPSAPGETVLIKPWDGANPLAGTMLELRPEAKAISLYRALPDFLLSVVRRGHAERIWARRHLAGFLRLPEYRLDAALPDLAALTDLQAASLGWLHHQAEFERLARNGPDRAATIEAAAFFADPEATLARAASQFELGLSETVIHAIAAGPVFARDSKFEGRAYDPAARKREEAVARFAYGEEIAAAVSWAEEVAAEAGIPMRPQSLS